MAPVVEFYTNMKTMRKAFCLTSLMIFAWSLSVEAQTAWSLFWRKDSVQVAEIVSPVADQYKAVGHHGPAVENTHYALRIYFNDSGAIDVYSKTGRGMELNHYKWYPDSLAIAHGAGCDEYLVGKSLGLGGFALWNGDEMVRLTATKGRTARAGETKKGAFAEIISYGVPYLEDTVDISVRIDMYDKSRISVITATELNGKPVQFVTGVNYHKGETVKCGDGFMFVWGEHPADVSSAPIPVGAGLFFDNADFGLVEVTEDMLRICSKPASVATVQVVAASSKEAEMNTLKRFESFMTK